MHSSRVDFALGDLLYSDFAVSVSSPDFHLGSTHAKGRYGTIYSDSAFKSVPAVAMSLIDHSIQSDDKLHDRVKEEIGRLICISHRHIQAVLGVATVPYFGKIVPQYVLFERVDGITLSDVITTSRPTKKEMTIAQLSLQIADALDYLHTRNIIHGDIKPSNIVMINERAVKLCNIALRSLDRAVAIKQIDDETRRYQAPEIASGREGGCASDVYSLGCAMLAMMLGYNPPILHDDRSAALHGIMHKDNRSNNAYIAKEMMMTNPTIRPIARVVMDTLRAVYVRICRSMLLICRLTSLQGIFIKA